MRELPKVRIGSKEYYLDLKLSQLRNVANPHEFKDFRTQFDLLDFLSDNNIIKNAVLENLIQEYVIVQ